MTDELKPMFTLTVFEDGSFEWTTEGRTTKGRWDSMKAMMISMSLLMAGVGEDQRKVKKK